jgi:hypothetical protein
MKAKIKVIVWLLMFGFILGGILPKEGLSFCYFSDCFEENVGENEKGGKGKKEGKKKESYSIEYSKPIFLDVENLYRNRTVYVVLVNFNVGEGLEKKVRETLFEELKKVGMNVVVDPRQGAYLMGLFLKKIDKEEVEVDVLIRERAEIKGSEGRVKFYSSDLDSVDHFTTVKIREKETEEGKLLKRLIENLVNFFKVY